MWKIARRRTGFTGLVSISSTIEVSPIWSRILTVCSRELTRKRNYTLLCLPCLTDANRHTKDGGWIEVQEILPRILCDDDSMLPDDPLRLLFEAAEQGLKKFGFKQYGLMDIQDSLKRAGYTNVQCIRRKVPVSPWARDKHFRSLGTLMKANIVGILGALAAKPLAAIDVEEKDRRSLMKMARQSLDDNRVHRYVECGFCFAQKGQARPTTPLDSGI